jgi:F-type H+-transporting ATPase subunit gamma
VRRAQEIRSRLRSLALLGEAVGAMKNLSAHHLRETRGAVEPARVYRAGVERLLRWAGARLAGGGGPSGLLVIGAELGLCGGYNVRLVGAAARRRAELAPGPTLCVGRRAALLLARRGLSVDQSYGAPTSVRGIPELLLTLAQDVLTRYVAGRLSRFEVVSARFEGVGADRPTRTQLLPLRAEQAGPVRASRYVGPEVLSAAAAREFLYITLYDLLLDALASEHGARLAATQAAERWLDAREEALRRRLSALRREATTQETLEVASGRRVRTSRGAAEPVRGAVQPDASRELPNP